MCVYALFTQQRIFKRWVIVARGATSNVCVVQQQSTCNAALAVGWGGAGTYKQMWTKGMAVVNNVRWGVVGVKKTTAFFFSTAVTACADGARVTRTIE